MLILGGSVQIRLLALTQQGFEGGVTLAEEEAEVRGTFEAHSKGSVHAVGEHGTVDCLADLVFSLSSNELESVIASVARGGTEVLRAVLHCNCGANCLDVEKEGKSVALGAHVWEELVVGLAVHYWHVGLAEVVRVEVVLIGALPAVQLVVSVLEAKGDSPLLAVSSVKSKILIFTLFAPQGSGAVVGISVAPAIGDLRKTLEGVGAGKEASCASFAPVEPDLVLGAELHLVHPLVAVVEILQEVEFGAATAHGVLAGPVVDFALVDGLDWGAGLGVHSQESVGASEALVGEEVDFAVGDDFHGVGDTEAVFEEEA